MRVFLSFWGFSVRGKVSIKLPTSKLHNLCFFWDILVIPYVLSCVPTACRKRQQWRL